MKQRPAADGADARQQRRACVHDDMRALAQSSAVSARRSNRRLSKGSKVPHWRQLDGVPLHGSEFGLTRKPKISEMLMPAAVSTSVSLSIKGSAS